MLKLEAIILAIIFTACDTDLRVATSNVASHNLENPEEETSMGETLASHQ